MIRRLDEQIMARTTRVLDDAAAAGTCNFVQDVAYQLPMHVIADIMGIPEADRPDVFGWTDTIMAAPDPESGISREDHFLAGVQLYEYARALGEDKRKNPTDDVWSILTTAEVDGEDGETWQLTDPSSTSSSSSSPSPFRDHPLGHLRRVDRVPGTAGPVGPRPERSVARRQRGRGDPALVSPVACFARTSTCDVELDGRQIAAGDRVSMWFPAANRDPRCTTNPTSST